MNLADITTKCYILALIIRDDGERLLLGDGAYEFKDSQQHFIANTYANDVVELQGTDGQMLAGQVRRTATQTFAGYIGDATFSKQKIEAARRDFLMFFRKKHYYTAVYVFSDGTAIQRDRGYIVNAPSVPELYQRFPEWSVGLNFEDPNYYEYAEDDLGQEIAAHKVELELSTAMSGGLIWDGDGAVSDDLSYVGTEIPGEGKNFQLADTGTATLKSAELLGDASQTTYTGKNLFYFPTDTSGTSANITITCPANSSSFTMNGTNNTGSNASKELVRNANPLTLPAGTYTIKIVGLKNNGGGLDYIYVMNASTSSVIKYVNPSNWTATFTLSDSTPLSFGLIFSSSASYSNQTVTVQIESGSTATAYEPYVGGTASPNPDYPQAIEVVTGEQTVKIEGKNLFDKNNVRIGYRFGSSGDYYAETGYNATEFISVKPNATYSTSWSIKQMECVCTYDASQTFVRRISSGTSFTTASNEYYIRADVTDANLATAQIELGSTATDYEPYQGQTLPVNLGKNLLDPDSISQGTWINASLTNTCTFFMPIFTGETFTISNQDTSTYRFSCGLCATPHAGTNTQDSGWQTGTSYTITAQSNGYLYVQLRKNDVGTITPSTTPTNVYMVERGSTATSFAPYFTPIELAKIGTYQDRIYKENDKWYVEKQVGKVVLDGSEDGWGTGSGTAGFLLFYNADSPFVPMAKGTPSYQSLCDHFTVQPNGTTWTGAGKCGFNSLGTFWLMMTDTSITTVADFKTWLASNPTTLYVPLATPTTTEITNSELVGQLERLQHSRTYADITNFSITATSPNLPAYLKVVAFGDDAIPQGGYVWEDGGTGGATTITVDGVDNAQPIWTVVGPATNPSLTNITTGESIQWTGVVPNGQTLVVNMADMTASLSGANVFEFISGSWITLQAGNNRVSYSATAATGIATLEWNGVVG